MQTNDEADGSGSEMRARLASLEAGLAALSARLALLEGQRPEASGTTPIGLETPAPPRPAPPPAAVVERPSQPPPLPPQAVSAHPAPGPERPVAAPAAAVGRPVPPPPLRAPVAAAEEEPTPLVQLLQALHLLPPSGGPSGEVQLGAWWATRIGALLVLLAVVFFGVYVSIGTPPWVKLAELAAVSVAVTFAGGWLERRFARFGGAILGSGMAMIFFTAFAAYAIPPVKVTDSIVVAAGLQAAVVALIFGTALRRDSTTVATMATVLGFFAAFFSIAEGFDDFAVFGGLALAAVSVVLRRLRGWAAPLLTSVVLMHVIVAAVAMAIWNTETGERGAVFVFTIVALAFAVFFASLVMEQPGGDGRLSLAQRWAQSLNGSLGALAGLIAATTVLAGGDLSRYFFAAGFVLAGAAVWAWRRMPADLLFSAFAVKASALITLGVMTEWGTRTRWIALLVEAFVLLAAAQRTRRLVLSVTAVAAWFVSLAFYLGDVEGLRDGLVSAGGAAVALYALASPVLLTLVLRQVVGSRDQERTSSALLLGVLAAVPVWKACAVALDAAWGPVAMVVLSLALVGAARALRSFAPAVGAAVAMAYAHGAVQTYSTFTHGLTWLWASALAAGLATLAGGWWVAERRSGERGETRLLAGALLVALGLVALFAAAFLTWPPRMALALSVVVSAGVVWTGAGWRRAILSAGGVVAAIAALVLRLVHAWPGEGTEGPVFWAWAAAAAGVALLSSLRGRTAEDGEAAPWDGALRWGGALVALVLVWSAIGAQWDIVGQTWAAAAGLALFAALAMTLRIGTGFVAASALGLVTMFEIASMGGWPPGDAAWQAMIAAWFLGVAVIVLPAIAGRHVAWIRPDLLPAWRMIHAFVGVLFVMGSALSRPAPWDAWTTVIWALAGIVVFLAGLFLRARTHRIAGLLVLGACLPRIFFVDINSTLYRIAAFVVVGLVLLWVGFSYQRFRHLIDNDADRSEPPGKDSD